jgi:hypothetical protein
MKDSSAAKPAKRSWLKWPTKLSWIPANLTWPRLRDVIRCALLGWLSILFLVITPTQRVLGNQASFLILVAAFIAPPAEPFAVVFEREILILLFSALSWA